MVPMHAPPMRGCFQPQPAGWPGGAVRQIVPLRAETARAPLSLFRHHALQPTPMAGPADKKL